MIVNTIIKYWKLILILLLVIALISGFNTLRLNLKLKRPKTKLIEPINTIDNELKEINIDSVTTLDDALRVLRD